MSQIDTILTLIAQKHLGIETLQTRNADSLDFHEVSVWGVKAALKEAYEAGRRAIIRCAKNGYPLPVEKYAQWQEIEIVFNPEKMRMK